MRKISTFTKIEFKYISLHRMENKKLLKFLLRDLNELDEMVTEKGTQSFDELEMEFLHTRVKGAKKLIQILYDRDGKLEVVKQQEVVKVVEKRVEPAIVKVKEEAEPVHDAIEKIIEKKPVVEEDKITEPEPTVEKLEVSAPEKVIEPLEEEKSEVIIVESSEKIKEQVIIEEDKGVELQEEETIEANNRLGDSFSKEKSVNDLVGVSNDKLEHKISNRPVANIQSAIGINDRFQFIRELFKGNAESFVAAVSELDNMGDIDEAVDYIQQNYTWKKNETSLKFVNLVKRRFLNE
jgi:hypothetical protein